MELAELVRSAKRVFIIGNGGSMANASHVANDLISCGVRAFTIDPAVLSMLANDKGWEVALAWWVSTVAEEGDLLIALSGSGTSPNIVNAVTTARRCMVAVHTEYGAAQGLGMQDAEERQVELGHDLMRALRG